MNFRVERFIYILFAVLVILYIFVEYPYQIEILWVLGTLVSLSMLINGIRFRIRRNRLIELGEQEHFHNGFLGFVYSILIFGGIILFIMMLSEWELLPKRDDKSSSYIMVIVFIPHVIRFLLGVAFKEVKDYLYITDQGILKSMSVNETYQWNQFQSYRILHDQNILRIRKNKKSNKPKYLFITYHDEYFKEHEAYILSILDKNLKSED